MADNELLIKIKAETDKAVKDVAKLSKEVDKLGKESKETNPDVKKLGKEFDGITKSASTGCSLANCRPKRRLILSTFSPKTFESGRAK